MNITARFIPILVVSGALTASATIRWQTTTATASPFPAAALTDQNNVALPADPGAPPVANGLYNGIGYFVQLLWAGPNGVIDPINTGTFVPGVSIGTEGTDDVVIDTSFIGFTLAGAAGSSGNPNGHIVNQSAPEVTVADGGGATGQAYYIRAFNAPVNSGRLFNDSALTPVVGGGLAPGPATTHYGNSALFTTSDNNDLNPETLTAAAFSTNIALVPEAGTAGLAGLGLLVLRRFLRRKTA